MRVEVGKVIVGKVRLTVSGRAETSFSSKTKWDELVQWFRGSGLAHSRTLKKKYVRDKKVILI